VTNWIYLSCESVSRASSQYELFDVGGFGADESADITNEFGGRMDPQLFGT